MLLRLIRGIFGKRPLPPGTAGLARIREAIGAGRMDEARVLCDTLLASRPDDLEALHVAGAIAYTLGDKARAVGFLTRAAESRTNAEPSLALGHMLQQDGRREESIVYFYRAVQIEPDRYESRMTLANALYKHGNVDKAEVHVRQAIALRPDDLDALALLAYLLYDQGRNDEIAATMRSMQRVERGDGRSIFMALLLPAIYQSTQEITQTRESLSDRVGELLEGPPLSVSDPAREIGITPFHLAYHGLNDCELQTRIVRLCRKAYRPACSAPLAPRPLEGRLRIGFVSEHFNFHSVGRMNHAFVSALPRDAFEVTVFSLRRHQDPLARKIRADSDRFVDFDGQPLAEIERVIADSRMDVLFFVDVGMDPLTYFLAYSRLAPLQLVGWGHPDTTGIDTLDCFISADALEVPEADAHYTERLVRLPCAVVPGYERPLLPQALRRPREALGLSDRAHIYACPQMPSKLHPDFDAALAAILRGDPLGEVVLVEGRHPNLTDMLKVRFRKTIPDVADRVRMLPHMSWTDYLNFIAMSDVMLDPFHFGGGNTTYESLAMGVPVVTLPPRYLRGRPALGCYSKMGMPDCVAGTPEEYARLALRLGTDADYRRFIAAKIDERSGVLFENHEMATALGEFLLEACSTAQ